MDETGSVSYLVWLLSIGIPAIFAVIYLFAKKSGNEKLVKSLDKVKEVYNKIFKK